VTFGCRCALSDVNAAWNGRVAASDVAHRGECVLFGAGSTPMGQARLSEPPLGSLQDRPRGTDESRRERHLVVQAGQPSGNQLEHDVAEGWSEEALVESPDCRTTQVTSEHQAEPSLCTTSIPGQGERAPNTSPLDVDPGCGSRAVGHRIKDVGLARGRELLRITPGCGYGAVDIGPVAPHRHIRGGGCSPGLGVGIGDAKEDQPCAEP